MVSIALVDARKTSLTGVQNSKKIGSPLRGSWTMVSIALVDARKTSLMGVQNSTKIGSPLRGSWTMLRIVVGSNPPLGKKLDPPLQHSLQSSIPITKTWKKWVMTLSSSMAMYSVMRDIPDARKVPMERGWVALYLYATCKVSNLLTLEQWAFEYGLPLFWYAL